MNVPSKTPLNMRQLQYFLVVADELNFSRAARRLQISASGLSQQVKALERAVGVQLLMRDTRHVQLTSAGTALARAGERLLRDAEAAVELARNSVGLIEGQLHVAALHEAEAAFESFLTAFHATYPGVRVVITTMRHNELIAAVRSHTIDAALTWAFLLDVTADRDALRWTRVVRTEVLAAVSHEHPLAHRDAVPRGPALRDVPAVLFERSYSPPTFDYAVEHLFGRDCTDPPVREIQVTVRAQEAMARHIERTGGLAPLSQPVADMLKDTWAIRPFEPPWVMDGCVVWRADNSSAALTAFMAAATADGAQPLASGSSARRLPST